MKKLLGGLLLLGMISSCGLQAALSAEQANAFDANGQTALMRAVLLQDIATVTRLLDDPAVDPNLRDSEGRTAFMLIAYTNPQDAQMLDVFLARDRVDVNAQTPAGGYNALMLLVLYGANQDVVTYAARHPRIDALAQDRWGRNIVEIAQARAHELQQELLRRQLQVEQEEAQARQRAREEREANKENRRPRRPRGTGDQG